MTTATQQVASPDVMLALTMLDATNEQRSASVMLHGLTRAERERLCQSFEQAGWTPNHAPANGGCMGYNSPGLGSMQVSMWLRTEDR